jgi:hypothetical protein
VEALKQQLEATLAQRRKMEEKFADVRQSCALRVAAQAKELEALQREAAEYSEDIKSSLDARRTAEAEKMRLERHKESLISSHSAEVAEMVNSLRRLQNSLAQYNTGILSGLGAIEAISLKAGGV